MTARKRVLAPFLALLLVLPGVGFAQQRAPTRAQMQTSDLAWLFEQYIYGQHDAVEMNFLGDAITNKVFEISKNGKAGVEQIQLMVFHSYRQNKFNRAQALRVRNLQNKINNRLHARSSKSVAIEVGSGAVILAVIAAAVAFAPTRAWLARAARMINDRGIPIGPAEMTTTGLFNGHVFARTFVRGLSVAGGWYGFTMRGGHESAEDFFLERLLDVAADAVVAENLSPARFE